MAKGKELVPYSSTESFGRRIKGIGKKIVKKIPGEFKFLGKVAKGAGKVAGAAIKNPLTTAAVAGTAYAMGASSRRYAKAPKFGENRNLNSQLIRRGI
jgi:hypothetical protein